MSQSIPILIAASVFAGGVGAVATTVLVSPPTTTSSADSVVGDAGGDLLAAVESLRVENQRLSERIENLEMTSDLAPVGSAGAPRTAAAVSESELKEAIIEALASMEPGEAGIAPTPAMQEVVENVIELREERERLQQEQRRAEAEAQRLETRLADLQTSLGLDQNQVSSMRTIFQEERTRQDEMRTQMREARESGNMDMASMREMWTTNRETTNQQLQGVLTAGQYEQYQESQSNQRWGGRGGRGGDDGGGDRRRGN